jgi:hypothetical protein
MSTTVFWAKPCENAVIVRKARMNVLSFMFCFLYKPD